MESQPWSDLWTKLWGCAKLTKHFLSFGVFTVLFTESNSCLNHWSWTRSWRLWWKSSTTSAHMRLTTDNSRILSLSWIKGSRWPAAALYRKVAVKTPATLSLFLALDAVKPFMKEKNKNYPELSDLEWIMDLAFLVDMLCHLSRLNLNLQGKLKLLPDLVQNVFALSTNWSCLRSILKGEIWCIFPFC